MSDLIYLYGFAPTQLALPPRQLSGVRGAAVELLDLDDFRAVFSRVHEDEFAAAPLEQRLRDLGWVAERGAEHEAVVAWCVDRAQIVPASLFTLYSSEAALRSAARVQRELIVSELQRLADSREWDLKVSYDANDLASQAARFSSDLRLLDDEIQAAAPGKRYLLERKRTGLAKAELGRIARDQGDRILAALSPLARETAVLPLPQGRDQFPVVLHAALLVERAREQDFIAAFQQQAAQYNDAGIHVNCSGPWAPYRFVRRG